MPRWWLLAQGVPTPRRRVRDRAQAERPDISWRSRVAWSAQGHGFTLKQIGRMLADYEGRESPLTERQVRYALRYIQADERSTHGVRRALAAFERANRDTGALGVLLYRELRARGMAVVDALTFVRRMVARANDESRPVPKGMQLLIDRAKHRNAARHEWLSRAH